MDHHHQRPDWPAYLSTCNLRSLEGNHPSERLFKIVHDQAGNAL